MLWTTFERKIAHTVENLHQVLELAPGIAPLLVRNVFA